MQGIKQMKCVLMTGPKKFEQNTRPIPKPQSGQVLIKVMAAPVNPSDLAFFVSEYKTAKKPPCVPGFEGSGLVVESGGGVMAWSLTNKKVAFYTDKEVGSYSQYAVVDAMSCFALDESVSYEQGSMSIVNPITVLAFVDKLKSGKHKSVIHTAASSQLGRMLNRVCQQEGIQVINIVRRQEQVDLLKNEQKVSHVLNSSDSNFDEDLKALAHKLNATICYDAVAGNQVGRILKSMPDGSTIQVYGGLSQEQVGGIAIKDLVFHNKHVKGFIVGDWIKTRGLISMLTLSKKIKNLIKGNMKSVISKQFPLDRFQEGVGFYMKNMTLGKVIFKPWMGQQQEQSKTISKEEKKEEKEKKQEKLEEKKEEKKEEEHKQREHKQDQGTKEANEDKVSAEKQSQIKYKQKTHQQPSQAGEQTIESQVQPKKDQNNKAQQEVTQKTEEKQDHQGK